MGKNAEGKNCVGPAAENRNNAEQGYQVLLADDDYEMRRLLTWSLKKQGYQVTECKDGNELMKKMGLSMPYEYVQTFDLIISDESRSIFENFSRKENSHVL